MRPFPSRYRPGLAAVALLAAGAVACATPTRAGEGPRPDHVIVVSVDGLRSDALLTPGSGELPHLTRLRGRAHTFNARTDPAITVTLPNHAGMLTARAAHGPAGHGWTENVTPPPDATLAANQGDYVPGVFDVLHAAGVPSALIATKEKFVLFEQTWNGGEEPLIGTFAVLEDGHAAVDRAREHLLAHADGRSFTFVHLREPDSAGHGHGWDVTPGSPYMDAVAEVDDALGRLFAELDRRPRLRARTAIILTSDHGGGVPFRSHFGHGMHWLNYTIPFLVWTEDAEQRGELYALNPATRADPSLAHPGLDAADAPPVRNSDAANLALRLLGLDAIPGSTVNANQDLRVTPRPEPQLGQGGRDAARVGPHSWPGGATPWSDRRRWSRGRAQ